MVKPSDSQPAVLKNITITQIAAEGKAIAKVDDMVIFVPHAVPGDVVDLKITKQKKRFLEAKVINLVQESPSRIAPFCQHYGVCGGCQWQILPYETQLAYKNQEVQAQLSRIGKVVVEEARDIVPSQMVWQYRNKTEFAFASEAYQGENQKSITHDTLGYHAAGSYQAVLPITHCHLQSDAANSIRFALYQHAKTRQLKFWDYQKNKGLLRSVVIRENLAGQIMITLICQLKSTQDQNAVVALLQDLSLQFPEIMATFYIDNPNKAAHYGALPVVKVSGHDGLVEHMNHLAFHVGPKSFYQTNGKQAQVLYEVAKDLAGLTGQELVYDLYTGTGTIALFIADQAKKVIGIEYVKAAIVDAKANAQNNQINHVDFFAGDMKAILTPDFIKQHGKPDVIITDPPRAGMDKEVIDVLLMAAPKRIVYVSCNPATQARDLALLSDAYDISVTQAVDMFPQTHHVENVVLLTQK